MAYDKVVDSAKLDADLTIVADAIREKTGGTDALEWPVDIVAGVDEVYEAGKTTILRSMTSLNYLFMSNNNMIQQCYLQHCRKVPQLLSKVHIFL